MEGKTEHLRLADAVAPEQAEQVRAIALEHLEQAIAALHMLPLSMGGSLGPVITAVFVARSGVAGIEFEEVRT